MDLVHINVFSVTLRLFLAAAIGAAIGFEREKQHQAAGLRTHMLICIGAALAMITNQYITENLFSNADPTRMGAQVISGMGFLGAGTIIVTQKQKVKGLTTAAGLWASACAGLAAGVGFYEGAVIGAIIIFIVIVIIQKFDKYAQIRYKIFYISMEIKESNTMEEVKNVIKNSDMEIMDMEFIRVVSDGASSVISINLKIKQNGQMNYIDIIDRLINLDGVYYATRTY